MTESVHLQNFKDISSHMSEFNVSAIVKANYFAKVSASTSLTLSDSKVTTSKTAAPTTLASSETVFMTLDKYQVRLLSGPVTVYLGAEGGYRASPDMKPGWSNVSSDKHSSLVNNNDLSSYTQTATGLISCQYFDINLRKLAPRG